MSKTDFAVLRSTQISRQYGVHIPGAVEKAYAGTRYEQPPIPFHVWAMVAIGVVGLVIVLLT